ncbi:MAG: hypothetical protein DMF86_13700 [Acidobacteria bacterium]|nr:MAG: hypothetical protein DMF86_13700 [Acidobacteriota bacterium]
MMLAAVTLLIVSWIPGAVIFRAPCAARDRRAALAIEERAFWQVILSVALSLAIVLALAAAHRYSFARLLLADGAVAVVVAVVSRFRLRLGRAAARPGWTIAFPIALIALGAWRFFPPAEYVIGGKDPGVYVNAGIQIAQRGTLVVQDDAVASVPAFARDLFFPQHAGQPYYSVRFMGFFIQDPATGAVISQFPHLYPASIAIGYGLDGLSGAREAIGVWAILGVLAVYFAGARLFGEPAAFAGAGLLALNVVEVWFSRYPNAEMVMQALMFAAVLATARAHVDGDPFFAPVAGALLPLLLFLRIDVVLAMAAVIGGVVLLHVRRVPSRASFWLPLAAGCALAAWYFTGPMRAYVARPMAFVQHFAVWQYALLAAAVLAVVGLLASAVRSRRLSAWIAVVTPTALCFVVVALATYAEAFRAPSRWIAPHDAYALRTFAAFYLTVPALIAALIGLVDRDGLRVLRVLLLQDSHRAASFLDRAAVPSRHPAGNAPVHRRGRVRGRAAPRSDVGRRSSGVLAAPDRPAADWSRVRRGAELAIRARVGAAAETRRVRGHHSASRTPVVVDRG